MRIDKYLSDKYGSRTKAATAVLRGLVKVNGRTVAPSYEVREGDVFEFTEAEENYVSAGGFKLSKALKDFGFSVKGKIFADIGASTGGFTDCLFQNGASKVYCVDVGESLLDENLKRNNIVIIDNFNARNLCRDIFADSLDGVTIDVSFISLTYILGPVSEIIDDNGHVLALIKPQFECENRKIGKNGIVRDVKMRRQAVKKVLEYASKCRLSPLKITCAPIVDGKNIEYVALFEKNGKASETEKMLKAVNL